ncbi:MFS transporter, partial [Streptomyces otsuchiensis]|uniref:MFS transporter n=1 Tax=Streptomyces otsuchiensis TaxID=2681388 RepID=UPI001300B0B3
PALAPHPATLAVLLAVFGGTAGMADVVMNAQGVEVEQRYGRSIMSGLHGLWSVGTLLGSAGGVAAVHAGVDARIHLLATALLLTVLAQPACRGLIDVRPAAGEEAPPRFSRPPRSAVLIGAVGVGAVLAEGAAMDWSGVYLRDVTGGSETLAAASYTAFACTMAAARLSGDAVVRRIGAVRAVRLSGAVATLGGLTVVVAPGPAVGIAGFALIGVGIAVVVPLAFAAAGRSGPAPGQAIAGVATITYTTGLVAPTLIGVVGEVSSLRMSFAVVATATALMILGAGVLDPGRGSRVAAGGARGGTGTTATAAAVEAAETVIADPVSATQAGKAGPTGTVDVPARAADGSRPPG